MIPTQGPRVAERWLQRPSILDCPSAAVRYVLCNIRACKVALFCNHVRGKHRTIPAFPGNLRGQLRRASPSPATVTQEYRISKARATEKGPSVPP